jgi:hypothetical protein
MRYRCLITLLILYKASRPGVHIHRRITFAIVFEKVIRTGVSVQCHILSLSYVADQVARSVTDTIGRQEAQNQHLDQTLMQPRDSGVYQHGPKSGKKPPTQISNSARSWVDLW